MAASILSLSELPDVLANISGMILLISHCMVHYQNAINLMLARIVTLNIGYFSILP